MQVIGFSLGNSLEGLIEACLETHKQVKLVSVKQYSPVYLPLQFSTISMDQLEITDLTLLVHLSSSV